jgi:SNF2 family DNA or RNA helicase
MGLGKTVSTLTALDLLLNDYLEISKVLITAPKRVAEHTWASEITKWAHLKHLTISRVLGTERKRLEALKVKANIYIINRENIAWLVAHYGGAFPFDCLVLDELSSYKNSNSARFKALRMVRPKVKRVIGLTGTPAPNGVEDLWGQMYMLDMGERLGNTVGGFRTRYLVKENEHTQFSKRILRKGDAQQGEDYYEKRIYDKISDICISMKARDYLDLPERVDRNKEVILPPDVMAKYFEFEKKMVLEIDDTDESVFAISAGVLTNKLRQFANGAIYDENKKWHEIHREKLEALEEDIEEAK